MQDILWDDSFFLIVNSDIKITCVNDTLNFNTRLTLNMCQRNDLNFSKRANLDITEKWWVNRSFARLRALGHIASSKKKERRGRGRAWVSPSAYSHGVTRQISGLRTIQAFDRNLYGKEADGAFGIKEVRESRT